VSAAGAVQFTAKATAGAASVRARQNSHGEDTVATHSNLNQIIVIKLSNPHVMTAYSKWAANQSTAKKGPF